MDRPHRVPLSAALALAILRAMRPLSAGPASLVFPSRRTGRPLSDMTLSAVLRRLNVPVTVHGFRSSFRDWAEEATAFPHEVKEAALAHAVANKVEAAYRRGDLFDRRRELMDAVGALRDRWRRFGRSARGDRMIDFRLPERAWSAARVELARVMGDPPAESDRGHIELMCWISFSAAGEVREGPAEACTGR